jgi:hypothetical protein
MYMRHERLGTGSTGIRDLLINKDKEYGMQGRFFHFLVFRWSMHRSRKCYQYVLNIVQSKKTQRLQEHSNLNEQVLLPDFAWLLN